MRTKMITKIIASSGGDADNLIDPCRFTITLQPPLILPPNSMMSVDKVRAELINIIGDITPAPTDGEEPFFIGVEGLGGAFCGMRIIAPPNVGGSNVFNLKHAGIIYMADNDLTIMDDTFNTNSGLFSLNNNKELLVSSLTFQYYGYTGQPLSLLTTGNFSNDNICYIQLSFYKEEDMSQTLRDLVNVLKSNNQLAIETNNTEPEKIDDINNN